MKLKEKEEITVAAAAETEPTAAVTTEKVEKSKKSKKKKKNKLPKEGRAGRIISTTVVAVTTFIFMAAMWGVSQVAEINFNQIIFNLGGGLGGTDFNLVISFIVDVIPVSVAVPVLYHLIFFTLGSRRFKGKKGGIFGKIAAKIFPIPHVKVVSVIVCIVIAAGTLTYSALNYNVFGFLKHNMTSTSFIYDNYTDPKNTAVTFPETKRNLVYIFMESTETTYYSEENGGKFNVMPDLEQLALENINFSNSDKLGGAKQYDSTDWTIAGMTAQTSGIPLKSGVKRNKYGKNDAAFLPGAYSLGDILNKQGYRNSLLIGSDKSFAGRDSYFTQHGNYKIYDLYSAIDDGVVEEKNDFWGFEDKILFELAKQQLSEVAADTSTPFNFTMLTVDTHYPYGWQCEDCRNETVAPEDASESEIKYANYKNALSCSSRKVVDFVRWIQQQPFYENTTIVISGDHLTMSKDVYNEVSESGYQRTTVNIFINAAATPVKTKNRDFGTFDMYPTTLAALGCKIEGERLGLGTNLFSDKATIAETIGYERLNEELSNQSDFYNTYLLNGKEYKPTRKELKEKK